VSHTTPQDDWTQIAAGCWVRRYAEWDVNVGVVSGEQGLLVVDTRGTPAQGHRLRDDVRRLDTRPVRWVVNTHQHFDHVLGNAAFDGATIHAHENAAAGMKASLDRVKDLCRAEDPDDPLNREVLDATVRRPDVTFSLVATLDLGDRYVEMLYPGRGHTDGDIAIRIPDLDVVFLGDLVEQSAPPSFGPDSFPLEWPETLEVAAGVVGDSTVVVPGHGTPVDRAFVLGQRGDVADVAATIAGLVAAGVPVEGALQEGEWPWDRERLTHAVRRGYEHAGPPPRTLPLLP
jgi:glyoxylase-like metal-dependent hydrolase (beta-lactamase superfamily II)